jgi:hypothetical protein
MATSAFAGLGLQNLGQENYTSGEGLDLGRFLLATGVSKSGLEGKLNDWGIGINNGKLGALKPVVPTATSVSPAASAPAAAQNVTPATTTNGLSIEDAKKTLMGIPLSQAPAITTGNEQQQLAMGSMAPPPSPIMGGVVPPTFDYMSGPGLRQRVAQAFGAAAA